MSNNIWPFPDPRVSGVKEHHNRIKIFVEIARKTEDQAVGFRLHIACIYFARGIIELIFEAADKNQISSTREELKKVLPMKLRWFNLIERIRIHDFHRFGIIPPNPAQKTMFLGGPVKVKAKKGSASYSIPSTGPRIETTGDSKVVEQRPLICGNGSFFDDDTRKSVTLEQIIEDFLVDVPNVIKEFEKDVG